MNDLVILPDQDGTGLKNRMISAMMLGMPVIASTAAVEGIVGADGKDFMLCRTSLDFINALNTLSADTSNRESLGQNASKISNQSYNTDAVMKNWLLTYKRIIHEK
jgi:glycosyltransferase involved in cell wall biosynthesis